jgi:fermentation-respiration switch protein FrsA (DUF1100 family)
MEEENYKISYETLWKFIIRPPRDEYDEDFLGDKEFNYRNKLYIRKDYNLISTQGYFLRCSYIEPKKRTIDEMPVVIYLHGNSSSRLEGLRMAKLLLKNDINIFVFDFAGSGLSEGEYITLGYHESHDLAVIVNFVARLPGVGKIGLWGRSMGAATTMIYAHKDQRIYAIVMDSPFADFSKLAKELVQKQVNKLPGFLISGALGVVGSTIKKKTGMEVSKLKPIKCANKTYVPALFIHALNDELINIQHTLDLTEKYEGPKSLVSCEGGHNSPRPKEVLNKIGEFFKQYLYENESNSDINKKKNKININEDNTQCSTSLSDENSIEEKDLDKNKIENLNKQDTKTNKKKEKKKENGEENKTNDNFNFDNI